MSLLELLIKADWISSIFNCFITAAIAFITIKLITKKFDIPAWTPHAATLGGAAILLGLQYLSAGRQLDATPNQLELVSFTLKAGGIGAIAGWIAGIIAYDKFGS